MTRWMRYKWYKTLPPEEKDILEAERRRKISDSLIGNTRSLGYRHSPESRKKKSESLKRYEKTEEHCRNLSGALTEYYRTHDSPMKGKALPKHPEEVKMRISATKQRIPLEEWKGYSSFEPYYPMFNDEIKEKIRNGDNRTCTFCGKGEILNGRRLDVHYIERERMQGCVGKGWYLCSLCQSCRANVNTLEKEFLIVTNCR